MTRYLKQNAVCVINCSWDKSELEKQLPAKMRKDLAEKQAATVVQQSCNSGIHEDSSVLENYSFQALAVVEY